MIGGVLDTLLTRYSYNWRFDHAAQYIYERFQDYGLDVAYHTYVISVFDFYGTYFLDGDNGWAVGSIQKVFRTRDGGATWPSQLAPPTPRSSASDLSTRLQVGWSATAAGSTRPPTEARPGHPKRRAPARPFARSSRLIPRMPGWWATAAPFAGR